MPVVLRWRSPGRPRPAQRASRGGHGGDGSGPCRPGCRGSRRSRSGRGPRSGGARAGPAAPAAGGGSPARADPGRRRSGSRRSSVGTSIGRTCRFVMRRRSRFASARQARTTRRWSQASNRSGSRRPGQVTPGDHQRVLHGILGPIDVAEDPLGERVEAVATDADQVGIGLPVTAFRAASTRSRSIGVHW